MDKDNIMKTGTTTVGIVCKDGIVLAADKRATAGHMIVNPRIDKLLKLTDKIAVTIAGSAADSNFLVKLGQAELKLRSIRTKQEISVKDAANLMARMVYNNVRKMSMIQGISHFLLAGSDETGYYLYDIFPDGSITLIDDFISSGSGSVMAYGLLETLYNPGMSTKEGIDLVVKCINAAVQRDSASGGGIDIVKVSKKGIERIAHKEVKTKIEI